MLTEKDKNIMAGILIGVGVTMLALVGLVLAHRPAKTDVNAPVPPTKDMLAAYTNGRALAGAGFDLGVCYTAIVALTESDANLRDLADLRYRAREHFKHDNRDAYDKCLFDPAPIKRASIKQEEKPSRIASSLLNAPSVLNSPSILDLKEPEQKTTFAWKAGVVDSRVMTIYGIPRGDDGNYPRPASPYTVKAQLWTADGQEWTAQWVKSPTKK